MINPPSPGHSSDGGMTAIATAAAPLLAPPSAAVPALPKPREGALSRADAARFRQMVDENFDFIWRSLRGLGVRAGVIDDAAQQVFWTASQKLSSIVVGSERSFLFATARGIAANARRAQQRNRELQGDEILEGHPDRGPDPEQIASTREVRRILDLILDGLAEDVREVFVLYELEGQTSNEISKILGIPMGTVASRLRRAREEFQSAARRHHVAPGDKP